MKHFEVVAAVCIQNDTVFCAQRKDSGEVAKKWEFPGGKIEAGESHTAALIREFHEELQAQIEVGAHLCTVYHEYKSFAITMHAYQARVSSGTITLSEHLDSRWAPLAELDSIDWAPADLPIVEKVKDLLS